MSPYIEPLTLSVAGGFGIIFVAACLTLAAPRIAGTRLWNSLVILSLGAGGLAVLWLVFSPRVLFFRNVSAVQVLEQGAGASLVYLLIVVSLILYAIVLTKIARFWRSRKLWMTLLLFLWLAGSANLIFLAYDAYSSIGSFDRPSRRDAQVFFWIRWGIFTGLVLWLIVIIDLLRRTLTKTIRERGRAERESLTMTEPSVDHGSESRS